MLGNRGPRIVDPYNTMGTSAPGSSGQEKPGKLDRLRELSKIKSDFDDAWCLRSRAGRVPQPQLERDLERAMTEQGKEIKRLKDSGVPQRDIDAVLDWAEDQRRT